MATTDNILSLLQSRYGIIGNSPSIRDAMHRLSQVAPTDLSVLITGETGTGKEVFANALHALSNRRKSAFIGVNCAAIPETLLESELFGHEKGAFTGATEQRKGFFEVANHGTIFLDEIGDMPFGTQVKLLRVLESGEFNRLGSTHVHKVDVRVVAATNRDLEYEVRQGTFRQDLFFRLNAVQIHLPPLRRHTEDIPELVEFFAQRVCERNDFEFDGVDDDAVTLLRSQPWRGNIRELRNLVETLVTINQGSRISADQVQRYLRPERFEDSSPISDMALIHVPNAGYQNQSPQTDAASSLMFQSILQLQQDVSAIKQAFTALVERLSTMTMPPVHQQERDELGWDNKDLDLENMERRLIALALRRYHGSRRNAARALGLSERTLYRKMQQFGFEEPE